MQSVSLKKKKSKLQRKLYVNLFACYTCFEIIDLHINIWLITLLPSNNPKCTSVLESSLHKNKYISLSLVLPLSLLLAPLPNDKCNITWRGSMCSVGVLFIYPHVPSIPLILSLLSLLKSAGILCLTQINCRILVSCLGRLCESVCESVHVWERAGLCTRAYIFSEVIIKRWRTPWFAYRSLPSHKDPLGSVKLNIILLLRRIHIWINI